MNNKKKAIIAGAMAAVFSITANFALPASTAEAGLGDLLGNTNSVVKLVAGDPEKRKQKMVKNLSLAAICYAQAAINVSTALNLDPGQRAQMEAALTNLKNNKTDLGSMQRVGESTRIDQQELENAARNLMDSGDQAKIDAANELIRQSKVERAAANKYKGAALSDATFILAGNVAAMSGGSSGDKINAAASILDAANQAKAVCDIIGANHKVMKDALAAYEKKNNIAEVNEKKAVKQMKDVGLE